MFPRQTKSRRTRPVWRHHAGVRRLLLLPALLVAGCGGSAPAPGGTTPASAGTVAAPGSTASGASSSPRTRPTPPPRPARAAPPLVPARCPGPDSDTCTAHTGRVITVESVDPDGDGDLHVIATGGSVTLPGITVFDVGKQVRPARDPRPGDRVTGAGPVYRGSHGQRQIQTTVFRVAPARG